MKVEMTAVYVMCYYSVERAGTWPSPSDMFAMVSCVSENYVLAARARGRGKNHEAILRPRELQNKELKNTPHKFYGWRPNYYVVRMASELISS